MCEAEHCTGPGQVQGTGVIGPHILYRDVHTRPRHGQGPEPIVSYSASPIPSLIPMQCE